MADGQLMHLAETEGAALPAESTTALYQEFKKRKLDTEIFFSIQADKAKAEQEAQVIAEDKEARAQEADVWHWCFTAKAEGKTDSEILKGLTDKGLDDVQAGMMVGSLKKRAAEREQHYSRAILTGGLILAAGLLVTAVTYIYALTGNSNTYLLAWGAILFGAIKFFSAIDKKRMFVTIRHVIQEQENAGTDRPTAETHFPAP